MIALAISAHSSIRLTEVGFLLFAIAGVWVVFAELRPGKWTRFRFTVAGALIATGAVLNIIAVHWGTR
jgi:hypothetical protein